MEIKIKKGLDIAIKGSAPHPVDVRNLLTVKPSLVAICPDDYPGFLPKAEVKEGDAVSAGSPLFHDKIHPDIKLVSPVAGTVKSVVRGERRKLLRIEVAPSGQTEDITMAEAPDFKSLLQRSGLWCMMRQRPFDVIPDPGASVRDIFVTAFDSAPLAPHLEYAVGGSDAEAELEAGVGALQKLTDGKVWISVPKGTPLKPVKGAEWVVVAGPHPSGQVGSQIAAIAPVNKGETVWTLDIVTLRKIGQLALNGRIDAADMINVAGPEVTKPTYLLSVAGADVKTLLRQNLNSPEEKLRIISGSVLTGESVGIDGFLRWPYRQLSVIADGSDTAEFMGWASPAASKPSVKRSVVGHFLHRLFSPDARINGGHRAMILSGEYDKVMPMDILAEYLIKAIMARDIEKMEQLGIYEVAPEDFALAEFVDTSKHPLQQIVREGLDFMRSEA